MEPKLADALAPPAPSRDEKPHDIVWNWKGTFSFDEWGAGCPRDCAHYRVVIEKCPGPCKVHIDVDGPGGGKRLDGVAFGTADREVLEVRFEGYRGAPPPDDPYTRGSTLFTLEAAPGDHMVLTFAALRSADGREHIVASHVSLARAAAP